MFWNNIFYPQTRISPVWNYEGVLRFACFQMPIQKNPLSAFERYINPNPMIPNNKIISTTKFLRRADQNLRAPNRSLLFCFGIWSIPQSLHKTLAPFQTRYRSLVIYAKYMFSKLVGILRGWWWFPQSSLMFSKASQSSQTESSGFPMFPSYPPPLKNPTVSWQSVSGLQGNQGTPNTNHA